MTTGIGVMAALAATSLATSMTTSTSAVEESPIREHRSSSSPEANSSSTAPSDVQQHDQASSSNGSKRRRAAAARRRQQRQRHLQRTDSQSGDDDDDVDMEADVEEDEEEEERPVSVQPLSNIADHQSQQQLYSLRWHDFQSSILSSFRHLRDVEDFVDVTLACDGKSFTAHKMVLSACSPYFRYLLKANPCQHPIVILRDVKHRDMEALLRFMYNGEVSVSNEQLPSVLHTARTLQVKGLADVKPTVNNKRVTDYSNEMRAVSRDSSAEGRRAVVAPSLDQPSRKRARSRSKSPPPLVNANTEALPPFELHHRQQQATINGRGVKDADDEEEADEEDDEKIRMQQLLDVHRESLLSQALTEGRSSQSLMAHLFATRGRVLDGNQSETSSTGHVGGMARHDEDASDTDDTDASDRDRTDVGDLSATEDNVYPSSGLMADPHGHHQRLQMLHQDMQMQPPSGYGGGPGGTHHPLLNLQGLHSLFPPGSNRSDSGNGPSSGGRQDHHLINNNNDALAQATRRSLDLMRIRATDPRPCPQCGKIYRSAHTLRTHLEDKHTVCPGYRCVLCGTVAKSRNSLHSHMSRQHRGISTKDLPVVPMPAPFDPVLASCLLAKAGVKVSPAELAARASPTSGNPRGRTADLRLDFKSPHSGGSLTPGSLPPQVTIGGLQSHRNQPLQLMHMDPDAEDLSLAQQRLREHRGRDHHNPQHHHHDREKSNGGGSNGSAMATVSPYGPAAAGLVNRLGLSTKMGKQWLEANMMAMQQHQQQAGGSPGNNAAGTGSALLDTYLQLIAEHSSNMAAVAAAAAAAQQAGSSEDPSAIGVDGKASPKAVTGE